MIKSIINKNMLRPMISGIKSNGINIPGLVAHFDRIKFNTMRQTFTQGSLQPTWNSFVGMAFDLSKGLQLTDELIQANFANVLPANADTTCTVVDGVLQVRNPSTVRRAYLGSLPAGIVGYRIIYDIEVLNGSTMLCRCATDSTGNTLETMFSIAQNTRASGTVQQVLRDGYGFIHFNTSNASDGYNIHSLSVRGIYGNHAYQNTSAARPQIIQADTKLSFDGVDDALIIRFPTAPGANCTVARAVPGVGASIVGNVNIGNTYTINTDDWGLFIFDRPLSTANHNKLEDRLNKLAGV